MAEACTGEEVEVEETVHAEDSSCCVGGGEDVDSNSPWPHFHCCNERRKAEGETAAGSVRRSATVGCCCCVGRDSVGDHSPTIHGCCCCGGGRNTTVGCCCYCGTPGYRRKEVGRCCCHS